MNILNEEVLQYKPKRMLSLWKNITATSVQIFNRGRIENLDSKSSRIWRLMDGETSVMEISQLTNLECEEVINIISEWRRKKYAIFNYSPLSPTDEKNDLLLIDTTNLRQNIDILFIVPPSPHANTRSSPTSNLHPLGIGYLISVIETQTSYSCDALNLWNQNVNETSLEQALSISRPKILGLSVMTDNYQNGVLISRIAKRIFPDIIVIMGGPHATFRGNEILCKEMTIDYIMTGESEKNIVPFLNSVFVGKHPSNIVNGVGFRTENGLSWGAKSDLITDLDALPYPKRSKSLFDENDEIGIITSRGCPGRCIFCCASAMSGNKYRMRSPNNVVQEIKYLYDRGARNFTIVDDTFTVNIPRMYEILSLIQKLDLVNVRFSAESRVDVVAYDINIFAELYKTGFRTIQFGVESGSQEILNKLRKRITVEQIITAVNLAAQANLTPTCTMLIGHPYETRESIAEAVAFAKKLIDLGAVVFFSVVTPYPGSEIGDFPCRYDISVLSNSYDQYSTDNPIIDLPKLSRSNIRDAFYDATIEIAKYCIKKRQR